MKIETHNAMLDETFLLDLGFVKEIGKFGEYFKHSKYELFRCWFHDGELQVGKKDIEKNVCIWIANVENIQDFVNLSRILTKQNLIELDKTYSEDEVMNILKDRDSHNAINLGGNNTWIDRPEWFKKYKK